jgi:hypothetical protein
VSCKLPATTEIPILFNELRESFVTDHGGFRLGVTGVRPAQARTDITEETEIPLMLCEQCASNFQMSRPTRGVNWIGQLAGLIAVAAVFQLVFQYWQLTLVAIVLFSVQVWRWRQTSYARELRRPQWLQPWIAKVRWFPEATRDAMEYSLSVGTPRPIRK